MVFGAIVTRGPSSTMARSSLEELDRACELFSEASKYSRRATKAFVRRVFCYAIYLLMALINADDSTKIARKGPSRI